MLWEFLDRISLSSSKLLPGTESILMSMKTHRDYFREYKGIDKPNIVCPITAHPAFDKAAAYFKIHIIHVPVRFSFIYSILFRAGKNKRLVYR
jgi:hypothetical protein